MEINREDQWVADRLTLIEPAWSPDRVRARAMLAAGLNTHRRLSPWALTAGAMAAVCVGALALPQTRALAQELWTRVALNRVEVVRVDLSNLPLSAHVTSNGLEQGARDAAEAERLAGFKPLFPASVLSASPKMSVTGPMVLEQTIHVSDIRSALTKLNATDVQVPDEWEGVTFSATIGPMLTANYPGEVQIIQARPFSLTMPTGFPLKRFAEVAFRSIGVSSRDAGAMATKFAANPAWLVDIPSDELVGIQEMSLVSGEAVLYEEYNDNGGVARETVILSTPERVYAVMSPNRDLSVKLASALR